MNPSRPSFVLVVPWDINGPGGVNQVVANLYREIARAGEFNPIVLVNRWSARRAWETVVNGRRTIYFRLSSPWAARSIWGVLKWLALSPGFFAELARISRRYRVAVYNVHYPSPGFVGLAMLRAIGIYRAPLIASFHGQDLPTSDSMSRIDRALWRLLFRRSKAVVAVSESFADDVRAFVSGAAPVVVIHNGLDIEHVMESTEPGRHPLAQLAGRRYILSVATFEPKKGLDVLIRALALIRRSGNDTALVLVGRVAEAIPSLRALATELDLDDHVFFVEGVPHAQIGPFFERASAFCLPSRAEPFGIVLLEAGAFRLPVVATRVGGIPEIIEDGESGLLVEPEDPDALAAALTRVLRDDELARRLGERLFERVQSEFSWRRSYSEYRQLLRADTSANA